MWHRGEDTFKHDTGMYVGGDWKGLSWLAVITGELTPCGSFMCPYCTKIDTSILNDITITAHIIPCFSHLGLDVHK